MNPIHQLLASYTTQDVAGLQRGETTIRALLPSSTFGSDINFTGDQNQINPSLGRCFELIKNLLKFFPEYARVHSAHDSSIPLHVAAQIGDVSIAKVLVDAYPQGVSIPNAKGKIPLHFAARMGYLNLVEFLLDIDPSCSACMTQKKKLPLHFSVGEGHFEVSKRLLDVYPEGAQVASHKSKLPIHHASRWGYEKIVDALVAAFPEGVQAHDWEGSLPIHDAARGNQVQVARNLIKKYPQGLCISNIRGEIPLSAAVHNNSLLMIELMVMVWPAGAKFVLSNLDEYDCVEGKKWEIIKFCLMAAVGCFANRANTGEDMVLISYNREDLIIRDNNNNSNDFLIWASSEEQDNKDDTDFSKLSEGGKIPESAISNTPARSGINMRRLRYEVVINGVPRFLPLHAALICGASLPVLQFVFKQFRQQVSVRNSCGELPLHLAAEFLRDNDGIFVSMLLSEYVEACIIRDVLGRFPLQVALLKRAGYNLVKHIIHANRAIILQTFKTNNCFHDTEPLFVATECDCNLDVIHLLLLENPCVLSSL